MHIHLELNNPLAHRMFDATKTGSGQVIKIPAFDARGEQGKDEMPIEIAQLPMVRKGGAMALIFDRLDSDANGVLTRSELINHRLQPMVTDNSTPAMPEESLRNAARAVEAKITDQAAESSIGKALDLKNNSTDQGKPIFPTFEIPEFGAEPAIPQGLPQAPVQSPAQALPQSLPQSLPESVVMAKTSTPAPVEAFA